MLPHIISVHLYPLSLLGFRLARNNSLLNYLICIAQRFALDSAVLRRQATARVNVSGGRYVYLCRG